MNFRGGGKLLKGLKAGFTLAEVLITLGIISIVVAMTLPILIKGYHKKVVETRLLTTYSLISQALENAKLDYGDSKYWMSHATGENSNIIMDTFFETYLVPYLKNAKYNKIDGYGLFKYGYDVRDIEYLGAKRIIRLYNGIFLFGNYRIGRQGIVSVVISVDINGPKPPNVVGRDVFMMLFSLYDGTLFMSGERQIIGYELGYRKVMKYDEILQRCKNGGTLGITECGALIKYNNWKIPKDYPYEL